MSFLIYTGWMKVSPAEFGIIKIIANWYARWNGWFDMNFINFYVLVSKSCRQSD